MYCLSKLKPIYPVKIELEVEVCTLLRKENKEEKRVTWKENSRLPI